MLDPDRVQVLRELKVVRSFDAQYANRIVNDPSIFESVAAPGAEHIDLTPIIDDPRNVLLTVEGGALIFGADIEGGIYELHTNFLPDFRGAYALKASREAYRWMFTHTDCIEIVTRVPAFNKPADFMARKIGFVPWFTKENDWQSKDGLVDVRFYALDYRGWLRIAAPELIESGREFHRRLDGECKRLGAREQRHADDEAHDLNVGAAIEMAYGGQPEKAQILYNRWARVAGYGQIALIARSPMVIDIGDAVLQFSDHDFKVIKCRLPRS